MLAHDREAELGQQLKERDAVIERLRDDRWKHGAESMRETILQLLPGGQSCDPQQIADMIRAIALPGALEQKAPSRMVMCNNCGSPVKFGARCDGCGTPTDH